MKYCPEETVIKTYCIPVPLISEQWHPKPGQIVFGLRPPDYFYNWDAQFKAVTKPKLIA